MQLYVDDPAAVVWGQKDQRKRTLNLMVLFWLSLGIPLSWKKGAVYGDRAPYLWIGVQFEGVRPGVARMTLPPAFIADLVALCEGFLIRKTQPLSSAEALVGKAGRVAHVLPLTRPFTSALYAALTASVVAHSVKAKEAPPCQVACRRFYEAALMLKRILATAGRSLVPLHRDVPAVAPEPADPRRRRIEVDASPWGGGGALYSDNWPTECYSLAWDPHEFPEMGVTVGS